MFDHLTETMLKSYYIAENTVGRFNPDKRALFFVYADIFLLDKEEAERLFALSQTQEVLEIQSEQEYHQYLRMKQYLSMNARSHREDSELDEIIDLKGTAFAENGLVLALNALGVLQ